MVVWFLYMTLKIIEHIIEGQIILLLMPQQLIFKIETVPKLLTIIVIECRVQPPDFRATAH